MIDQGPAFAALLTTAATLFVVELTDKDALFLLALATKARSSVVFAAGAVAFTASTAIIVAVGSFLVSIVPVFAIKLAGGVIMLGYAALEYYRFSEEEREVDEREAKVLGSRGASEWSVFVPALLTLITLDLAGDGTELVTVVLIARFGQPLLVFSGAVVGLIAAVAAETIMGNALGRFLSRKRIKYLSIAVFAVVGTTILATTLAAM